MATEKMATEKKTKKTPSAAKSAAGEAAAPAAEVKPQGFRRRLIGIVRSDKMDKTVTVEVVRRAVHPKYKKYIKMRDRYKAHDETNEYKTGDQVEIQESRPMSRDKRWSVVKLLRRQEA